jgi:hypothetical protein
VNVSEFKQNASSAIRYWEPRRILYNGVLAAVVVAHFLIDHTGVKSVGLMEGSLVLLVLAVLANVAYCAAYPVDIFVQHSAYRDQWLNRRWILLLIGVVFAAVITHFFAMGMFSAPGLTGGA